MANTDHNPVPSQSPGKSGPTTTTNQPGPGGPAETRIEPGARPKTAGEMVEHADKQGDVLPGSPARNK